MLIHRKRGGPQFKVRDLETAENSQHPRPTFLGMISRNIRGDIVARQLAHTCRMKQAPAKSHREHRKRAPAPETAIPIVHIQAAASERQSSITRRVGGGGNHHRITIRALWPFPLGVASQKRVPSLIRPVRYERSSIRGGKAPHTPPIHPLLHRTTLNLWS